MTADHDQSLDVLIQRLTTIKVNGGPLAIIRTCRDKCDFAFLPFAESEIQFIDRDNLDEAGAHILALHEGAFTLREQCDSLLRSKALEDSEFPAAVPKIIEALVECCARIENICSLRRPDLLSSLEPVL